MGRGVILTLVMLSLVLLTGYAGQVSLCELTFVGVGAFAMGKVTGGDSILGLFAAVGLTAVVGALIALPALRLRGLYLALTTFAFRAKDRLSTPARPALRIMRVFCGSIEP